MTSLAHFNVYLENAMWIQLNIIMIIMIIIIVSFYKIRVLRREYLIELWNIQLNWTLQTQLSIDIIVSLYKSWLLMPSSLGDETAYDSDARKPFKPTPAPRRNGSLTCTLYPEINSNSSSSSLPSNRWVRSSCRHGNLASQKKDHPHNVTKTTSAFQIVWFRLLRLLHQALWFDLIFFY